MKTPIKWHNKLDSLKCGKFLGVHPSKLVDGREHQCRFTSVDGKQTQGVIYHSTQTDPESIEAILELAEVNEFYERLNSLQKELNGILRGQSCTFGKIAGLELGIIRPPAGQSFRYFQPECGVKAFSFYKEVVGSVYDIEDYDIEVITTELKTLCNVLSLELKERFDTGNF